MCLSVSFCMHASVYAPMCLSLSTCACVYMHIFLSTCLGSPTHGICCEFSLHSTFIPVIDTSRLESLPQPFWVPNWGLAVLAKASDLLFSPILPSVCVVLGNLWQCAIPCYPRERQPSAVPAGGHVMFHHPPWDCRECLGLANSALFVFWFCKYTEDQVSVLSNLTTGYGFPFALSSLYVIPQRWRDWNPTANLTWCVTLVSEAWSQGAQEL